MMRSEDASPMSNEQAPTDATALAVALYDLAWLLPRTVGLEATGVDPLPQSELEVMRLLVRRPGLNVNEIARELGMQSSNASATIRTLVMRGLLERRRDENDRRVTRLHPTRRAIASRARRERSWGESMAHALGELGEHDASALIAAVGAMRALAAALASAA
jgi:DNA-binding MarR family transcriptional regulator